MYFGRIFILDLAQAPGLQEGKASLFEEKLQAIQQACGARLTQQGTENVSLGFASLNVVKVTRDISGLAKIDYHLKSLPWYRWMTRDWHGGRGIAVIVLWTYFCFDHL